MSLRTRLVIALGVSLVLVAGLGAYLFRRPARTPGENPPGVAAPVALDPVEEGALELEPAPESPLATAAGVEAPRPHAVFDADEVWLLTGRVVRTDEAGEPWPVAGARVILGPHPRRTRPDEAPPPARAVTGEDGRFELPGCPGRLWMRLDVDEPSSAFRAFSFQLGDPDASGLRDLGDIALEPAMTMQIELVGAQGQPVEKGRVLVGRDDSVKGMALDQLGVRDSRREAREAGRGKYVLERTGAGKHSIRAFAAGHAGARQDAVLPHEGPVVVRLTEGKLLAGKVLDQEGKPLAAAVVELESGPGLPEPDPTTATDAAGAFRFDILSEGEYEVEARADGYTRAKLRKAQAGLETVELTLYPESVLGGRVVSADGDSPVARARVSLAAVTGEAFTAESGPDGEFTLRQLPAGTYFVAVTHREHARYTEEALQIDEASRVEGVVFKLPPGLTVSGTVVDADTQAPVAGAQVFFDARPGGSGGDDDAPAPANAGFRRSGQTNAGGRFELKGLGDGEYLVSARATGYLPGKPRSVLIAPGAVPEPALSLARGGSISGRVADASRNPVAGAVVRLLIQSGPGMGWNEGLSNVYNVSGTSDAEGKYTLVGLPAHKGYGVEASHTSHPDVRVSGLAVELGKPLEDVDLEFPRSGSVRGRVVDDSGAGLAGVTVHAAEARQDGDNDRGAYWFNRSPGREKSAPTDKEGGFVIEPLRAGSYRVTARAADSMSATRDGVVVGEEQATEGIELVLGAGERLRGRVVDADGQPIAQANVAVSAGESAQAQTDAEGRFEVKGLARGDATVSASKSGFDNREARAVLPARQEMQIQLDRLARISGTLRAEGVTAFRWFRITAEPARAGDEERRFGGNDYSHHGTDPAGAFEIDVKAGTYKLHAYVEKFEPAQSQPITVVAGERVTGIVIDLERGGTVEGIVVGRVDGAPIEGAQIHAQPSAPEDQQLFRHGMPGARSDAEGRFKLQGLPGIALNVTAQHEAFAMAMVKDIRVPRGSTHTVRIELSAGGAIRGVVRKGGQPVAQVQVYAHATVPGQAGWKDGVTDAEGRFELKGLPAGEYSVQAHSGGRRSFRIQGTATVFDGQTSEIELSQDAGLVVSGRVSIGGVPAGGGHIEAIHRTVPRPAGSGSIDARGEYTLEVPGPGAYTLMVSVGGPGGRSPVRADLVVPAGAIEHRQDIDLPAGQIAGIVHDAATGEPIEGAEVIVLPDGVAIRNFGSALGSFKGMSRSREDGRFEVTALEAGVYALRVSRAGYADVRLDGIRVDGRPGGPDTRVPMDRGVDCRVVVADQDGNAVEGAMLLLRNEIGDLVQLGRNLRSAPNGVVELRGVRPGAYEVSVLHSSFAVSRQAFAAAAGVEAVLTLEPAARMDVEIVNRRGQPVAGAGVDVIDESGVNVTEDSSFLSAMRGGQTSVSDAQGRLTLDQIPPGKHRVAARTDRSRSREEKVTLEAGKRAQVRLVVDD